MNIVVIDANVIAKTFIAEPDSEQAMACLQACVAKKISMIAPDILKYEIMQIAIRKQCSLEAVISLFDEHISTLIELRQPNHSSWLEAEKISQYGHEKSGFPYIYDSIYHAMAIVEQGIFITADKCHYEKSKNFEHIVLLENWHEVLQ